MRKFLTTLVVVALAGAGLVACGGDDDDAKSDGTDQDAGGGGGDDSSDDTSVDTDTDTGNGDGDGTSDADAVFQELLEKQKKARIRVTYTSSDQGEPFTISQDGDGRVAYITGTSSSVISDGETTVQCDGIDTDTPSCTTLPSGLGDLAAIGASGFFGLAASLFQGAGDTMFTDTSNEEIAGRDAVCTTYDPSGLLDAIGGSVDLGDLGGEEGLGEMRVCVDEATGFLLLFESTGGGAVSEIVATEVGEPDDSDFEPPVEPTEIPGIGDIDLDDLSG